MATSQARVHEGAIKVLRVHIVFDCLPRASNWETGIRKSLRDTSVVEVARMHCCRAA